MRGDAKEEGSEAFQPAEPAKPAQGEKGTPAELSGERSERAQLSPAELAEAVSGERTAEGLLAKLSQFKPQLGCGRISLAIFRGSGGRLLTSTEGGRISEDELPPQGSSFTAVERTGKLYVENKLGKYSDFFDERQLAELGYRYYACAPVKAGGKVIAAISLASKEEPFGQGRADAARLIATLASLALSSASSAEKAESSEAISHALFENAAEVVILADASTGRILAANSGAEAATGYGRDELSRLSVPHFLEGGLPGEGEATLRLVRKTGDYRLLRAKRATFGENGRQIAVITGYDVTEKMAYESDFRDVVESISDIIFSLNGDGEIISVNDEVEKILGRRKDSLTGAPFGSIVYDQDYKRLSAALQELRGGSRNVRALELRLLTSKSEPRWFEMSGRGYYTSTGQLLKVTGVLKDIEERRRAVESGQMAENFLTNSSDAVIETDTMGLIQYWNKGAESVFGFKAEEIKGRDVRDLYPNDRRGDLDALIRRLNEAGSISDHATVRLRKGGEQLFVKISASALKDEEGRVVGYMEMMKDMTEERKAEEAERARKKLEERYRYLQELNEMKSVFVSNVSHELRTPLTSIHGYSALLLDGTAGRLEEEQKEFVEIIHSETDRLTRLINDLLDLSRMERGKFKLSPRMFDLRDLVEKCSCPSMADAKGLSVQWNFEPGMPEIYGDPARMSQVLINLISNAIKFTDRGGVTVSVSRKGRSFVQVDVIDTGHGISQEDQKKLFKPFSQIPRADGQKKEGTGLGLAISREIVKMHGGKIWIERSEPGKGTQFSFTLRTVAKRQRGRPEEMPQNGEAAQPPDAQAAAGQPAEGQPAAMEQQAAEREMA